MTANPSSVPSVVQASAPSPTPPPDSHVLRDLLAHWALHSPDAVFAVFEDGSQWTYAQTLQTVRATALGLQQLGVQQGDHVLVWLPNGADCLRTWFAVNWLGAVYVSINTAYRGALLTHVVRNSGARLLVTLSTLVERLAGLDLADLRQAVLVDTALPGPALAPGLALTQHGQSVLQPAAGSAELQALRHPIQPWHTQSIYFTSGTTGPSKGVLSSYTHLHVMSRHTVSDRTGQMLLGPHDRYMLNLPLFHVGGLVVPMAMLAVGGSVAVLSGFDTTSFWPTVARTQTTCAILLGVMAAYLVKQPVQPGERPGQRHSTLRHIVGIPLTEEVLAFSRRFGVDMHTLFNKIGRAHV